MKPAYFVIIAAIFVIIGDGISALWAKSNQNIHLFISIIFTTTGCLIYLPAIKTQGLSWVVPFSAAMTTTGGVITGICMGESMTIQRWIGLIFVLIAVFLLH